ncbi:nucleotide exchange factor GrpE [Methanogenium cariaci]|uniref:nucleotide exchange factor GrpE n=1 Tax=Methanogenium cariaci TaxID=2197 RepID=UPI000ABE2ECE|nr:nucleotide exchange factor GrpE [Methanogenium cariaci]
MTDNPDMKKDETSAPSDGTTSSDMADNDQTELTDAERLVELYRECDEQNKRYLRLAADFENYKRRVARETEERSNRAVEQLACDVLVIADNIERALASDENTLREGVEQIHKLLESVLNRHEIIRIECLNLSFNPETQEAVAYVPSDCNEGTVIDEIQTGYCRKGKVIRCARVAVSQGKTTEA